MEPSECLPPELERFWRTDDGLTATERARAFGIDLSLLEDNLRLTPGERLQRNDAILGATKRLVTNCITECRALGADETTIFEIAMEMLLRDGAEIMGRQGTAVPTPKR